MLNDHQGGESPEFHPDHPLGHYHHRIPDQVVVEHVISAVVHRPGYERIATEKCSDHTIGRRLTLWAGLGIAQKIHAVALATDDLIIGLELQNVRRAAQPAR